MNGNQMLKKILYIVSCSAIISCTNSSQTEPKPSLKEFPSVSLATKNVVHSVGFEHDTRKLIVTNSFTGEKADSCEQTTNEYKKNGNPDKPKCNVKILDIKENQQFLALLKQIEAFNSPVLIETNGKVQEVTANFLMMANYKGSCGSLTRSGGDQIETRVECFSTEQQLCVNWVANGWDFVKAYPPCNKYYP